MTQVGEGQEADEVAPPVMTFGAPAVGEILAERYELAAHINDDSVGRQVWRGVDVVLRRPVAVVLRYPGGDSATEMLQAAVTASRVIHPNLVGVYDAIDEGERAYVVREWVDGRSLRELISEGPLDATRATSVAHAVAGAVAAIHATGMVHGNIHPGTVMVGDDGRVVLVDARTDNADTAQTDVRAVGGILYYALTGHWPHAEAALSSGPGRQGRAALPDAMRDASGALAAPRQVRAGVPAYLDDLTMDLLDAKLAAPAADVLAAELGRLDAAADDFDSGPLRFTANDATAALPPPIGRRKMVFGIAGVLAVILIGVMVGIGAMTGNRTEDDDPSATGAATPTTAASPSAGADTAAPLSPARKLDLKANQVRVIDPEGDGRELVDSEKAVDGDPNEGWETDRYVNYPNFGNNKKGMGLLIDLGEARTVASVKVDLSTTGASAELRTGTTAPGDNSRASQQQVVNTFTTRIGEPYPEHDATTMTFGNFEPDQKYRYLLFWITKLPPTGDGGYKIGVQEITVSAR